MYVLVVTIDIKPEFKDEIMKKQIRVSTMVSKERQWLIKKAAADRNMKVDKYVGQCVEAVLRAQGFLS